MLDKDKLAEAARYADARAEELGGLMEWAEANDIDIEGLFYVAQQRALRACMLMEGKNPNVTQVTLVSLSPRSQQLMPILTAAIIDGIAIGYTAKSDDVLHRVFAALRDATPSEVDETDAEGVISYLSRTVKP